MARSAAVPELPSVRSTMSNSGCDLDSLRDELAMAVSTINKISEGMSAQVVQTKQECTTLKARISELEAERQSTALHLQRVEAQNAEMRQLLQRDQPELARALQARDAALRKLHAIREIARDLLDEQKASRLGVSQPQLHKEAETETESSDSVGTNPWSSFNPTEAESSFGEDDDDMGPGGPPAPKGSVSAGPCPRLETKIVKPSESMPSRTTREAAAPTTPSSKPVPPGGSMGVSLDNKAAKPLKRDARCDASKESKTNSKSARVHKLRLAGPSAPTCEALDTDSSSKNTAPPTQQDIPSADIDWYIECQRPPATAIQPIALSFRTLGEQLRLDDDMMVRMESMGDWREPSLKLHIYRDMAFIYDPVFLEAPTATYLISWGNPIVNTNIKRYLTEPPGRPTDRSFHMFVKNVRRDIWYYLGRQQFIVADLPAIWHTKLDTQGKHDLVDALSERWTWQDAPHGEQIVSLIETGRVTQCAIELRSSTSLRQLSQAFAEQRLQQ